MEAHQPNDSAGSSIISPFSDSQGHTLPGRRKNHRPIWVAAGVILLAVLAVGGYFLAGHLNDPLRTLEPFPVGKYMENYKALAGSKFRASLRVENDLGWKEGTGRIMVFTVRDDPHPIVTMIPPSLATIYFVKGQSFEGELEVKEGGLIYANSIRKD